MGAQGCKPQVCIVMSESKRRQYSTFETSVQTCTPSSGDVRSVQPMPSRHCASSGARAACPYMQQALASSFCRWVTDEGRCYPVHVQHCLCSALTLHTACS